MRKKIGQLDCIIRDGDEASDWVVLLHGFGADAGDLAPLADVLDAEGRFSFCFPEAPLEVPIGPSWTGRGWFPISLRDLEVGVDFTQIRPPGLDLSRKLVSELLFHLNPRSLVLGGFSQGAMVAVDTALHQPEDVMGLLIYSGVLLDEENWSKRSKGLSGKRFLQSHGQQDQVLPFKSGERLYHCLKSGGAEGPLLAFSGGHEIPFPVIQKSAAFLKSL